jgi:carboxymethylenebutenolidase
MYRIRKKSTVVALLATAALSFTLSTGVAAQDWARAALEQSPRHQETIRIPAGARSVHSFLVYPEVSGKAGAVIVIHENRGLTDWVRLVADRLAGEGFIAIAPDLLSGTAPGGGNTADFANPDAAREGIYALTPDQVTGDLNAVVDYLRSLPASNGQVSVVGFCWGGSQSFNFATNRPDLSAVFVFYGTGPTEPAAIARINCPVYGFYGGNDARVNATIPQSTELMQAAGKSYHPETYEGAGHAFMRLAEEANAGEANRAAREASWKRLIEILKALGS